MIPARAVRDLPAGGLVGLEDWNVQEYEGTPRYHRDRALALLEEKRYADSLGEFLALARQEPSQLPSLEGSLGAALLGAIEGARARARYGPLLGTVTELLDLAPDLGAARIHAARLHLEAGRYETAARLLLGMREIPPGSGEVVPGLVLRSYVEWGGSLLRVGRAREAASVYEEGLERTGRDPALLADLGRARMALGDYDGARVAMEEALVRDAGLAGVLEGELEDVYLHLGGEGILAVDIPKDSRLIPVEVLVSRGSSREIETMYIDSGASWSFLTRDFAARLGIQVDGRTRMAEFATANGRVTLPVVVLDEVNFRGFIVRDVEAAVGNLSEESFRGGVLGNNFLRHFSITIDRPRGKMTFEAVR